MQVILLEKIVKLGNLGEVVRVRDGYARNYMIPQKIARRATADALKELEDRRVEHEKHQAEKMEAAQELDKKLADDKQKVSKKAGVEERCPGLVTKLDWAAAW